MKKQFHGTGFYTTDDLFFMSWGHTLFEESPFYVMKYYPNPQGERRREGRSYSKVKPPLYAYDEMIETVREVDAEYIRFSKVLDRPVIALPDDRLEKTFDPFSRAREIVESPSDPVEKGFRKGYTYFESLTSDLDIDIGVTASLLFGMHDPQSSDIDIVFRGDSPEMMELQSRISERILDGDMALDPSDFEREMISDALGQEVNPDLLQELASQGRYISSLDIPGLGRELHVLFIKNSFDEVSEGEAAGREAIEGTVRDSGAKYVCPEFTVETGDQDYVVVCYHKAGALVQDGDEVRVSGHKVKRGGRDIIVQLDEKKDVLRIQ